jgi:pyruvate/2-oxoacid:ferredoxin oxidoreductase beta subunit
MSKTISLALVAAGMLLLIFGVIAYDSSSSDVSRFVSGSAVDRSVWLFVGGLVGAAIGLGGLLRVSRRNRG